LHPPAGDGAGLTACQQELRRRRTVP